MFAWGDNQDDGSQDSQSKLTCLHLCAVNTARQTSVAVETVENKILAISGQHFGPGGRKTSIILRSEKKIFLSNIQKTRCDTVGDNVLRSKNGLPS